MHRQPGRWLLAWSKEQGWSLLPQDAFPEPHTALGLVPGAAQQENHLSLPGDRRGARPCLPWPSTAPAQELVPAESGRKERRTVACTFNDFNCQVFSASGWKIVIRARSPRRRLSSWLHAGSREHRRCAPRGHGDVPGGRSPPLPPSLGPRHSPAPCQFPFFTPNPPLRAKRDRCRAPSTPPGGGRPPASPQLTVVAVPHAVLENRPPLLLLLARHHAEVVVPGVGVPEDQGEIRGALDDGGVPRLGRHACGGEDALKGQGVAAPRPLAPLHPRDL